MSLKNTNSADKMRPTPILNRTSSAIGYSRKIQRHVNVMSSMIQKMTKTQKVKPKLIRHWTLFDIRNKYFGTFTFVKIEELDTSEVIPCEVDSLKKLKIRLPQKRYVVK